MKKIVQNLLSSMMIFALVISAFNMPLVSIANAQEVDAFSLPGFDLPGFDFPDFNFGGGNTTALTCNITANNTEIFHGGSVTLSWDTPGADLITINGQVVQGDTGSIEITDIRVNTTYTVSASANGSSCQASVQIICLPSPVDCRLELTKVVDKATALINDTLTYTITIQNTGTTNCTGTGVKIEDVLSDRLTYLTQNTSANITPGYDGRPVFTPADRTLRFNGNTLNPGEQGIVTITAQVNTPSSCGDFEILNQARATALELNNFGTFASSQTVRTLIDNDCPNNDPAPTCDSFTATPATIAVGGSTALAWQTTNASRVVINNGVGERTADGTVSVAPLTTTTYQLTAFGTQNRTVTCDVPVVVGNDPVPVCTSFTATPNMLPSSGGTVTLNWNTNGATSVSIAPTVGVVALIGTQSLNVTANTNFVLTATDADGDQVTCAAPVTLTTNPPNPSTLTCAANVSFTTSRSSINQGEDATLSWSTTNVDSLTISGIDATALSGSMTVTPTSNITYLLNARRGTQSVDCPLSISVNQNGGGGGGGGGGGSSSPRCEITLSDSTIKAGKEITLKWDTTRANQVTITDSQGKKLVDTDKLAQKDRSDFYDGTLKLRPTRDTEYTLLAERGSKDRTCTVKVNVDDLKVITDRDQQPLVAGIALSNVPYTGFGAGPILTVFFYTLLAAWALFVSYLIISRRQPVAEFMSLAISPAVQSMQQAEAVRPDAFVASMAAPAMSVAAPKNLPVAPAVIGYESFNQVSDDIVTTLENRAHTQNALLSSDAIRHFMSTTEGNLERNDALDEVIAQAKGQYPLEDGWVVINEARMKNLCDICTVHHVASASAPFVPTVIPEGSSSLAEAIVTGNIVAAYEMIGGRPMFALADAAADLDSVLRNRRGETNRISDLLANETAHLSEQTIKNMITALTGALDGTYTDEASAVKIAIMKAVKEIA